MAYALLVGAASALAGAIAAVSGFGIGSVLTPLFAARFGVKTAVAAVSVPHLAATAWRFAMLRRHVDRRVLLGFGLASAAGGLLGALLHARLASPWLGRTLGALLVFAGLSGLTGLARRLRFSGPWAWAAGLLSGAFGGLVGNQGGIRSAALLGLDVPKEALVATATASALLVDAARMPVYVWTERAAVAPLWPLLLVATGGALAGTVAGRRALERLPEALYRRVVSALLLALGAALLAGLGG